MDGSVSVAVARLDITDNCLVTVLQPKATHAFSNWLPSSANGSRREQAALESVLETASGHRPPMSRSASVGPYAIGCRLGGEFSSRN